MSASSRRALPAAIADLLEQVDQAIDPLGAGSHQPQSLNQALDVPKPEFSRALKKDAPAPPGHLDSARPSLVGHRLGL
jgi:hypothetical protein